MDMTVNTVRDKIWQTAITLAVNGVDDHPEIESEFGCDAIREHYLSAYDGDGFSKNDLIARVDAGDRTVHDVLKTMVEMGLLRTTPRRLPRLREHSNGYKTTRREVTVYHASGDLASSDGVETSDLIGYDQVDVTDRDTPDSATVDALREQTGI